MAAKTSAGTGTSGSPSLWSVGASWVGGAVPVSGTDTVSIAAGDYVKLDSAACTASSLTVGTDPGTGGTAAITIGTDSQTTVTTLLVDTGLTLRLQGDLTVVGQNAADGAYSRLTLSSGASLIMDPPSAGTYKFNFSYLAEIVSNGATNTGVWPDSAGGNHCIIKTDLARSGLAAVPVFLGGLPNSATVWGGFTAHTFTEFSNIGNATIFGVVVFIPNSNTYGYATKSVTMTNCTFSACNYWVSDDGSGTYWTGQYQFNDNLFSSSVACSEFTFGGCAAFTLHTAPTVSTKEIRRNAIDLQVNLDGIKSITVEGNVFGGNLVFSGAATWTSDAMFADNLLYTSQVPATTGTFKSVKNCYFVSNLHNPSGYIQVAGGSNVTACIFEAVNGEGDAAFCVYQTGAGTMTVTLCMVIGINLAGYGSGSLVWALGGGTRQVAVEHNLAVSANDYGMVTLGLAGAAAAGQVVSCRSNILYISGSPGASAYVYAITESGSSTYTNDAVTVAGYNGYLGANTGTVKTSAGGVTTGSVPLYNQIEVTTVGSPLGNGNTQIGYGDFSADPQFVAPTRKFAAWGGTATGGGVATVAGALATLLANPALITKASTGLLAWIRAGYVPTNAAYLHATYPGDAATTGADGLALNGTVGPLGIPVAANTGGAALMMGM